MPTVAEKDAVLNSFMWYFTINDVFPTPESPSNMTCKMAKQTYFFLNETDLEAMSDRMVSFIDYRRLNLENEKPERKIIHKSGGFSKSTELTL